jgi:hypothetical protein
MVVKLLLMQNFVTHKEKDGGINLNFATLMPLNGKG